jgi:hypothetical protein
MFNAIEDIPTKELMAEIRRRWTVEKLRYLVWSDRDPNDSFEVEAVSAAEASWAALDELGWCVSATPIDSDEIEEEYN